MPDLSFTLNMNLNAGAVTYIDPVVEVDHDCKMDVEQDGANLVLTCEHGTMTLPFGSLNFKEAV